MRHALDERLGAAIHALGALEGMLPDHGGDVAREERDGIRWLLLDHPRAHNALTARMMRRLAEEIRALQHYQGAVVALASIRGGSFCAGGHLGQVRAGLLEPEAARLMSTHLGAALEALRELPVVSVSVLEGAAIGGGVELASATDFRVGTESCWFDPAQVRLGVACGWGGAARLAAILGRGAALRFLARSERVSAAAAADLGLLDAIVGGPASALEELLGPGHADRVASLRAVKTQLSGGSPTEAFLGVWGGPAHRRALQR